MLSYLSACFSAIHDLLTFVPSLHDYLPSPSVSPSCFMSLTDVLHRRFHPCLCAVSQDVFRALCVCVWGGCIHVCVLGEFLHICRLHFSLFGWGKGCFSALVGERVSHLERSSLSRFLPLLVLINTSPPRQQARGFRSASGVVITSARETT